MDPHLNSVAGYTDAHNATARDQQHHNMTQNGEKSRLLQQHLHQQQLQQHHSIGNDFQEAAAAPQRYIVHHHRFLTTLLVAVSRVLENTDASLLPAVYLYVGCAFSGQCTQLPFRACKCPLGTLLALTCLQSLLLISPERRCTAHSGLPDSLSVC
jgi:hypothetical protein